MKREAGRAACPLCLEKAGAGSYFQLMGEYKEDRTRLFLEELGDLASGNGESSSKGCFN